MHPRNYDIAHFETDDAAKLAGYTLIKDLTPGKTGPEHIKKLTDTLMGMNRQQRRAWLSQRRKAK